MWGIENFNKVVCFLQERMTPYLHLPVSHSELCWSSQRDWRTGGTIYFVITITPVFFGFRLRELGYGACGTVRVNRRGVPKELTTTKLAKGEVLTAQTEDGTLALKWMDKRPVTLLSTIHDDTMVTKVRRTRLAPEGREEISKPHMVEEYNRYMGGVDSCCRTMVSVTER